MKTNRLNRIYLVIAITGIFLISCKKDNTMPATQKTPPPVLEAVTPSVSVIDYGAENGNFRTMRAVINTNSYTVQDTSNNAELSGDLAQIVATFYVSSDGIIASGEYSFSNSEVKTPFTFDSASLIKATDNSSGNLISDDIVKGKIVVTQNGNNYIFNINCGLLLGKKITTAYAGSVTYLDESN
jgi:hypothetical protein